MSCCVAEVGECLKRVTFTGSLADYSASLAYNLIELGLFELDVPANSFVALRSVVIKLAWVGTTGGGHTVGQPYFDAMDTTVVLYNTVSNISTLQRAEKMFADEYAQINDILLVSDKTCDIKVKLNADSRVYAGLNFKGGVDYSSLNYTITLDFKTE